MIPTSVSVNPSSGSDAESGASSGGGNTTFYFGGNPTAAALGLGLGQGASKWLPIAVVGVIGVLILTALLRR